MNVLEQHKELDLRVRRPLKKFTEADWEVWTSEAKVIADMLKHSGMQDKTIALEIGVDNAVLSKAQTGMARLSENHTNDLMDACGSEAWLFYWILKRGYDPRSLRRIETEVERENRELKERIAKMEEEREIELRLFSKLRTA
jgi:hypothetical protein